MSTGTENNPSKVSAPVLVLYAGGTIGMERTADGYQPMPGFEEFLLEKLQPKMTDPVPDIELMSLERLIDSANLVPDDWNRIGEMLSQHWHTYSGFVVLHGTDTMAYTASMLSFMLQGSDKAVILTGSQIPLSESRNDALDNLLSALILAANPAVTEVCVFFNGRLLRGNRSTKVNSQGLDAFDSPNYPWLGRMGIKVELNKHLLLPERTPVFQLPPFDPAVVTVVHTYPGMPAQTLRSQLDLPELRGLVLLTYGAGNPPAENLDFIKALEQVVMRGVVVVNISQCIHGGVLPGSYATGAILNRIGVLSGTDMTLEAAFTKLLFQLASKRQAEEIMQTMAHSICGELTEES